MQFFNLALLALASLAAAAPLEARQGGGDIGACEQAVANEQTACFNGCGTNGQCYANW
jgi:hypothetical protein